MNTVLKADADAPDSLVVRRRIAASAAELFDAWLDPQALALWMRPTGIRRTTATTDARMEGRYEIHMEGWTSAPVRLAQRGARERAR